jgi:uncharacterized protein YfkK (UPF0435 family)
LNHVTITAKQDVRISPCLSADDGQQTKFRRHTMTNLELQTQENVAFMIEVIKTKLKMASAAAMQASNFDLNKYEDIKDLYEVVASKEKFSISEVEALVSELGKLRIQ